jgi:hypothetical protein
MVLSLASLTIFALAGGDTGSSPGMTGRSILLSYTILMVLSLASLTYSLPLRAEIPDQVRYDGEGRTTFLYYPNGIIARFAHHLCPCGRRYRIKSGMTGRGILRCYTIAFAGLYSVGGILLSSTNYCYRSLRSPIRAFGGGSSLRKDDGEERTTMQQKAVRERNKGQSGGKGNRKKGKVSRNKQGGKDHDASHPLVGSAPRVCGSRREEEAR